MIGTKKIKDRIENNPKKNKFYETLKTAGYRTIMATAVISISLGVGYANLDSPNDVRPESHNITTEKDYTQAIETHQEAMERYENNNQNKGFVSENRNILKEQLEEISSEIDVPYQELVSAFQELSSSQKSYLLENAEDEIKNGNINKETVRKYFSNR